MAHELSVDAAGLRLAATNSEGTAAALAGDQLCRLTASRPSSAGVAAVYAALTSIRSRQARRMTGQADNLLTSSARYDTTDSDGYDAISGTVTV